MGSDVTGLVGGVLLGFALALPGLIYLTRELRIAQDRLLHAWQAGTVIAPREPAATARAIEPLTPALMALVTRWESTESQLIEEAKVRGLLANGWDEERIVRWYAEPEEA